MSSEVWTEVLDDLESLCLAWRLLAGGNDDVEIVELPTIPSSPPPAELETRVRTALAELTTVGEELTRAYHETGQSIQELRAASSAAEHYLRN